MAMYYKMSSDMGGEPNVHMKMLNNKSAQIRSGRYVTDNQQAYIVQLPFRFEMKVRRNEEDDTRQVPRMMAYYEATQLMQKGLVSSLKAQGVDNVQEFPALLVEDGSPIEAQDYVVVNIVGTVACASVADSDSIPFADRLFFNDLVIDTSKTQGLLMFRLAESLIDVLVHESVAKPLIQEKHPYLVFTPLKQA